MTCKAAESAENHARLVDAMSELKAKENTIHELHKIVKAVKVAKCRKKLNLLLFCFLANSWRRIIRE